jgi:hypothetical protein
MFVLFRDSEMHAVFQPIEAFFSRKEGLSGCFLNFLKSRMHCCQKAPTEFDRQRRNDKCLDESAAGFGGLVKGNPTARLLVCVAGGSSLRLA